MNARRRPSAAWIAFVATALVALAFAVCTNHVWEDYYITYRASKNLATGYGLVFNHGDRLHTFTSPLGVLLPALAYVLTGNSSDTGALWLFRLLCCGALGGAAALLVRMTSRLRYAPAAAVFVVVALLSDAKSLDFTINGMETAFMLLFLALAFWAQVRPGPRPWLLLGAAWAGLMWTRPDSFIYVALIAGGFWIFNDFRVSDATRRALGVTYLRAAAVTTALYLPWVIWATLYYGTPVPFTITAKGSLGHVHTVGGLLLTAAKLLVLAWTQFATLELTFLPSYYMLGGWPGWIVIASRIVASVVAVLWLVPRLRLEARVASFAFFGAHVYLTFFPYFPFPWYLPATTLLAIVALGGTFAELLAIPGRVAFKAAGCAAAIAGLTLAGWLTVQVGRQVSAQQRIVETGTRRAIGEWLKVHSSPGDAVFMEPLGYIGFFSGLKTYDYPGMSSREMVHDRAEFGEDWGRLLFELKPRWVVLRPFEVRRLSAIDPALLTDHYRPVQTFDRSAAVARLSVYGRRYLEHDDSFTVFELERPFQFETKVTEVVVPFPATRQMVEGSNMTLMHAPSRMTVEVPRLARAVTGHFCIMPAASEGEGRTDGAGFRITYQEGQHTTVLLDRRLDPVHRAGDRHLQTYAFDVPRGFAGAVLRFETSTGPTANKDWTCWDLPVFR